MEYLFLKMHLQVHLKCYVPSSSIKINNIFRVNQDTLALFGKVRKVNLVFPDLMVFQVDMGPKGTLDLMDCLVIMI